MYCFFLQCSWNGPIHTKKKYNLQLTLSFRFLYFFDLILLTVLLAYKFLIQQIRQSYGEKNDIKFINNLFFVQYLVKSKNVLELKVVNTINLVINLIFVSSILSILLVFLFIFFFIIVFIFSVIFFESIFFLLFESCTLVQQLRQ